ncbi:MAG: lanthionine synthetase LanC family protein [Candidatus Tumulicola sp.]
MIDAEAAQLVREFSNPSTIAQAVARFSRSKSTSAERLLEAALPMLESLIESGLLTPSDSPEALPVEPSLVAESIVDGWKILRCVQTLEDTELYQARGPGGRFGAFKIGRSNVDPIGRAIAREARILSQLDASVSPELLASGEWNSRPYLLMEWLSGSDAKSVCAEFRACGDGESRRDLLRVTGTLLEAYARLHARGVVHGDVHPHNLLIDRHQAVRIVDFGLARRLAENAAFVAAPRAGVGFYFEPEVARAALKGVSFPPPSAAGEQYSLAAMLYLLLAGSYYLEFSLEKQAMLRQISEDPMVPFAERDIDSWPDVERLLGKALSKRPADRFPSVAEFARAWLAAKVPHPAARTRAAGDSKLPGIRAEVRRECAIGGALLQGGPMASPAASINYGSAGVAYALYRIACASDDAELLALADVWSARAVREVGDSGAFHNEDLEITAKTVGAGSLYHGPAGVYAVQALIAQARGDGPSQRAATLAFVETVGQPCGILDLTMGRAGALLGSAFLLDAFGGAASSGDAATQGGLRSVGNKILEQIRHATARFAAIGESTESINLGIAHGWAGLLYAACCWCAAAGDPLPDSFDARLRELAECSEPIGRGLHWKRDRARGYHASAYLSGWCNGSAGYVFLWTQAYHATGEAAYLELAEGAAWNVWETANPNPTLCCGVAGQAYALLNYYRHSGRAIWLRRARDLADSAAAASAQQRPASADAPEGRLASLYKGAAGLAVLAADLDRPEQARMPMFEREI